MPRNKCLRFIDNQPGITFFKPTGIPIDKLTKVVIQLDEYEAIRLADLEGFYQEEAAKRMNISRQTFGRIIESAHRKIADALINGKAVKIDGGNIETKQI
ncbi:MAG: DUF134 domain-containing protein [Bacteroidales bacterium]